jgi:hypothetical protein
MEMGIESWDKALKAERHNSDSGRSCAGLDMSKVPAGAAGELVEAALDITRQLNDFSLDDGIDRVLDWARIEKALAPFVKEEHEYKPGPWDDDRDDEF